MSEESNAVAGARVEFKVALKGRALAGQAGAEAPSTDTAPAEEIPRVARLLALAHRWQRLIDQGRVRDQAEIARLMGLSRARVTQIMVLQHLAPALQHAILLAEGGPAPTLPGERQLRALVTDPEWARQLQGTR